MNLKKGFLLLMGIMFIGLFLFSILIYFKYFGNDGFSNDQAIWAQFGDYI